MDVSPKYFQIKAVIATQPRILQVSPECGCGQSEARNAPRTSRTRPDLLAFMGLSGASLGARKVGRQRCPYKNRLAPNATSVLSQAKVEAEVQLPNTETELGLLSKDEAGKLPVVRLPGLLSDHEINKLLAAAQADTDRRIGTYRRVIPNGPWSTWYLHTGGWLQATFPALCTRLAQAVAAADNEHWGLLANAPCAKTLGQPVVRTAELHTVEGGGGLPFPDHHDYGSMWTLDIMLAEPGQDFSGAEFQTLEPDGKLVTHEFCRGDGVVFPSHKRHCVSTCTGGIRRVLIIEFWHGEQRTCSHRCHSRWGPCKFQMSDADIWRFYEDTTSGQGGLPAVSSLLSTLIVKQFHGEFSAAGFVKFTGKWKGPPAGSIGEDDIKEGIASLIGQMKCPSFLAKGGPRFDATEPLEDDGRGWVWLAAERDYDKGVRLKVYKSVPIGKMPLLVAPVDGVDALFNRVNWDVALDRLYLPPLQGPDISHPARHVKPS
eukprot:TRINITY_DN22776_c0_g2_i1.p1 TRINITY_DN22776_c0_g2~~TRINITY_DN22776_c0_g2_i1.p1  ORF type:complete len:488 (+),score=34.47 TRINITY_DN22776_c0_g2_i1:141-1604(+)